MPSPVPPAQSGPLAGRAVLVTGGLGGIGREIAAAAFERGAMVYVSRRRGAWAHGNSERAVSAPRASLEASVRHVELDVTCEADWSRAVDSIVAECGGLYGLVNNAGLLEPAIEFTALTLAQWRRHMAVNLDGCFLGCRFAMRAMQGGGAIVNISSGAAYLTVPDAAAYCTSKAAVLALTRVAAKAGAARNVRVNAVLPGAIDTPMLWRNLTDGAPAEFIEHLTRLHPIGRIGTPGDVAAAVAFLLDPENGFVTGALLAVDGGQLVG